MFDTGPAIDLSSLTNLSSLTLSPELIFGHIVTAAQCPWAEKVWKVLPPRLESLHMDFYTQGIFWTVDELLSFYEPQSFDSFWEERIEWHGIDFLLGLVHPNRGRTAPPLAITLYERPENTKDEFVEIDYIHKHVVQWNMPAQLNNAARMAGANLKIRLGVPFYYKHPDFEKLTIKGDWEGSLRIHEGDEEEWIYYN
ncbi:uncharacterized protein F4817DRAFT_331443 [Daldinia loculata]|uniref:uncharacterized protein n=1 Tax=Daldinia loculata TaxID=103429 RepID=UPI0020C5603C|nr:uncharacterized protein F4817DRAFT_331443 [Daldinia loculata]KAI1649356.1 hypothetical protein F4817DRAFT_331443 [Daldinia loculata]